MPSPEKGKFLLIGATLLIAQLFIGPVMERIARGPQDRFNLISSLAAGLFILQGLVRARPWALSLGRFFSGFWLMILGLAAIFRLSGSVTTIDAPPSWIQIFTGTLAALLAAWILNFSQDVRMYATSRSTLSETLAARGRLNRRGLWSSWLHPTAAQIAFRRCLYPTLLAYLVYLLHINFVDTPDFRPATVFLWGLLLAVLWVRGLVTVGQCWRDPSARMLRFPGLGLLIPLGLIAVQLLQAPFR